MNDLEILRRELLERGDEMISFQQLVERFDSVEKEFGNTPWNLKQIYSNFNILIGEKPNKWIHVSEGLPDLDDYDGSRVWQKKVLITGYLSFDDAKELFVSEAFAEDVIYDSVHDTVVTAWMPLPEPYKASPTGEEVKE